MRKLIVSLCLFFILISISLADCPPADIGGDCVVDFEHFAKFAQ